MSDTNDSVSVLIVSDDSKLVDSLIRNSKDEETIVARDSIDDLFEDDSLLESNAIVIFDIDTGDNTLSGAIDQVLNIKQHDPSQVLILVGESELLAEVLKSNIQPLIYRAFNKPVSPNQVSLAFKSGKVLHTDLLRRKEAGEDISLIGPAENRTSVDSIANERNRSNVVAYGAIGLLALAVFGWLLFGGSSEPETTAPVAIETTISDGVEEAEFTVSASVQRINELNQLAAAAMLEEKVIAPKGDNALEYYDQVLAIDAYDATAYQGKKAIADRLRASYNTLVNNAEFDRALKVINVLQRIEPLNLDNDSLRKGLEKSIDIHVKKIQQSGTSEEIAKTTAVLEKIESDFEGSKSASDALKAEKRLVTRIDTAIEANNLTPPAKGNAYGLVSESLKSNTVSKANIIPRVESLSSKLLVIANGLVGEKKIGDAEKIAALVKRLNVDKKGLTALTKKISAIKTLAKQNEEKEAEEVAEKAAAEPVLPKIIPAKIISRASPRYPNRALNKNQEGWVEVNFSVNIKGEPININVKAAEPIGVFDDAALRAVKKWRFSPARNEETGRAVVSDPFTTRVAFKLD